ncbi:hypothetical protein AMTR_s04574p00001800, partial [Amborella trichopoda]
RSGMSKDYLYPTLSGKLRELYGSNPTGSQFFEEMKLRKEDFCEYGTFNRQLIRQIKGFTNSVCDAAEPWQLGSQDAATSTMQGIIDLHHDIFFFLIVILVFVLRILVRALWH